MRGPTLAFVAIGCLSTFYLASPGAQGQTGGATSSMPTGIQTAKLADGSLMLTDAKGMTLYTYLKDPPGQSNCNDGCAAQWPPVAAEGMPPSDAWTVITRIDGSKQWAYRGKPLYGWVKDGKPGDITGEGVAGAWKIAALDASPNLVKVHLAHIASTFPAAPKQQGLLTTAVEEARIAARHAALAEKAGNDLDAVRLHVGHVMHAVDPTVESSGPGLGFGVKRAAMGVSEHIQLVGKVQTASNNVLMLSTQVLSSANNTVKRCDEIIALGRRIRAAATAAEAAPDVTRLKTLTVQLVSGLDLNKDGQVGWQAGEGGLEQIEAKISAMQKDPGR